MDAAPVGDDILQSQTKLLSGQQKEAQITKYPDNTSILRTKDVRVSDVNVRLKTNIGSGATPAFEPSKIVSALVTDDVSLLQHGNTPSGTSQTYALNDSPWFYHQPPENYWSTGTPGQVEYINNVSVPRYIPDGSPDDLEFQQYHNDMNVKPMAFVSPAYTRHHPGYEVFQQGVRPGKYADGLLPYRKSSFAQRTPSKPARNQSMKKNLPPLASKARIDTSIEGSHTNSRTWTSQEREEWQKFRHVQANLHRTESNIRSPFVPKTFDEWLNFRAGQAEDRKIDAEKQIAFKEKNKGHKVKIAPPFGGKQFNDGKGAVLGKPTIWHEPFDATKMDRPVAEWPCLDEMKEEGDQRNTSKLGRHLAFPRVPSDVPMHYKARPYLKATDMDVTWQVPTAETYEELRTADLKEVMRRQEWYLGGEIMRELDYDRRHN